MTKPCVKKCLVVGVILLFFGLALAPSINADVRKQDLDVIEEDYVAPIELEVQRIRDLVQSIDLRKIIVNPDAVVDTMVEISTIIEENENVRNYIEKSSDEDCGCEGESALEWRFPAICTLLYPLLVVSAVIFLAFHIRTFYIFMENLGSALNCYWALPPY